jgi:hypothetical protein
VSKGSIMATIIRTGPKALILVTAVLASGCSDRSKPDDRPPIDDPPADPISVLVVERTKQDVATPDPTAAFWRSVPRGAVTLMAQPMIAPRPEETLTEVVAVQAVHDGTSIAFRLVWSDPDRSEAGRLHEFSDALALQFPVDGTATTPVMMGAEGFPVHIYHWRAQYQRDKERGKPEMTDLYPNMSVDMYPMDFKEAPSGTQSDKESFSPGLAAGNPQSYAKNGIDEIIAEGFSTSAVQEGHSSAAHAVWHDGRWALVITRPLEVEGGSSLKTGQEGYVAFAAWQGGESEVGSRKSVTMSWLPMEVR